MTHFNSFHLIEQLNYMRCLTHQPLCLLGALLRRNCKGAPDRSEDIYIAKLYNIHIARMK